MRRESWVMVNKVGRVVVKKRGREKGFVYIVYILTFWQSQGFRMIIGSPTATSTNAPGLKWVCLSDKGTRFPELNDIPQKACAAGIMSVHHFPA